MPGRRYRVPMFVGSRHHVGTVVAVGALLVGMAGCSALAARIEARADAAPALSAPAVVTTSASSTAAPSTAAPRATTTSTAAATTTSPFRSLISTGFGPMASVGDVVIHHPGGLAELVGLHESGHDGAQVLTPVPGPVGSIVLTTRHRGTAPGTAADVVVASGSEIRVPVTGTVLRAGAYTLYCRYTDEFVVIEPDGHPGWEVRIFHIEGVAVAPGQHVDAAVTRMAAQARTLPFASQVDESTSPPHLPHVHVELVDTAIPDRPTPGMDC